MSPALRAHIGLTRRATILAAAMAFASLAAPRAAPFPDRPVRIVVPLAAGGPTDVLARIVGEALSPILGQQVLVENRTGASGQIAVDLVARSKPDGYTILMTTLGTVILPTTNEGFSADTLAKFAPVSEIEARPVVIVVPAKLPVSNIPELIAYAKANPGKLHYGAQGASDILGIAQLRVLAGIDVVTVRYQGGAPALQAVVTDQVQFTIGTYGAVKPFIDSGQVRAIAVTGLQRYALLPDTPTVAETVPGFEFISWTGLSVPAGTPTDVVQTLNGAVKRALSSPAVVERFTQLGTAPAASTPEEFGRFFASEIEKWAKVAKESGFKPQ